MALPTKEEVFEALKPVQDPEIRIGIVDLGLVYDADISENGKVTVKMTLTTPACPYGEMLVAMVHRANFAGERAHRRFRNLPRKAGHTV